MPLPTGAVPREPEAVLQYVARRLRSPEGLAARARAAGGLAEGTVSNRRPEIAGDGRSLWIATVREVRWLSPAQGPESLVVVWPATGVTGGIPDGLVEGATGVLLLTAASPLPPLPGVAQDAAVWAPLPGGPALLPNAGGQTTEALRWWLGQRAATGDELALLEGLGRGGGSKALLALDLLCTRAAAAARLGQGLTAPRDLALRAALFASGRAEPALAGLRLEALDPAVLGLFGLTGVPDAAGNPGPFLGPPAQTPLDPAVLDVLL